MQPRSALLLPLGLAVLTAGLLPRSATAFCGAYLSSAESPATNATSTVVYVREGNRSTITMSNDILTAARSFTMLIPAPGTLVESDVKVVDPGVVARVETYAAPRLVEYSCDDLYGTGDPKDVACGCATDSLIDLAASAALDQLPGLLDQLDVGFGSYQISTLAADTTEALETWAQSEGLFLPAGSLDLFEDYIEGGASFISVKVDLDSVASGGVLLKPIQFSYESDVMSLPIRLGTINAGGSQDVVLHVITDTGGAVGISNYPEFTVEGDCMFDEEGLGSFSNFYDDIFSNEWNGSADGAGYLTEYKWAPTACDPCTGGGPLSEDALRDVGYQGNPNKAVITRLHMRYNPGAIEGDLMLYDAGRNGAAQHQQRYILYKSALEEEFPICGEGYADNPGTCEDDTGGSGRVQWGAAFPVAWLLALGGIAIGRRRALELD
jgi:hypothetical protein